MLLAKTIELVLRFDHLAPELGQLLLKKITCLLCQVEAVFENHLNKCCCVIVRELLGETRIWCTERDVDQAGIFHRFNFKERPIASDQRRGDPKLVGSRASPSDGRRLRLE